MIGNGKYIFNPDLEPAIYYSEENIIKNFMLLNVDLVIDEVGIDKHTRARYIRIAKKYGYTTICMMLPKLTMKECVDRRMKDPHGQPNRALWESVWKRFNKRYQKPMRSEGFDRIIQLTMEDDVNG